MLEQVGKQVSTRAAPASPDVQPVQAFIRIARVKEISGLSKSTLWRWIKAGNFPAPVLVSKNKAGPKQKAGASVVTCLWDLAEVMAWRQSKFLERDKRRQQGAQ